jgi:hypothetical protein
MNIKKTGSLLLLLLVAMFAGAQEKTAEMADVMRSNGRIYVVVAVVVLILLGLILYMIRIDRKIGKLEKEN